MREIKEIIAPVVPERLEELEVGEIVHLSGVIYTARDAAHKRMVNQLREGKPLPIELRNQVIFYVGPSPARPGRVIGSCGPTTSSRMDSYAPLLLEKGLKVMVGKGPRSVEVVEATRKNRAVYLAGIGGAAALMARCVKAAEVVDYADLGTEAIHRLEVEKMPLIVAIDTRGNNLYEIGPEQYRVK
jgi:fumarate hydratase subunit beta